MRWRYSVLILAVFTLAACGRGAGARAPWTAMDTNEVILGSPSSSPQIGSSDSVLATINDVECGKGDPPAYLVDVAWVTTVDDTITVDIEYQVVRGSEAGSETMDDPERAETLPNATNSGSATIKIPNEEVVEEGDLILIRVTVSRGGMANILSPVAINEVTTLCR